MNNLIVWHYPAEQVQALGTLADRSMTLQEGTLWISQGDKSVELTPTCFFGAS